MPELDVLPRELSLAPLARGLRETGRRGAKAIAEAVLPRSMVVWRGAEARRRFGKAAPPTGPGRVALTFDDGPDALTLDYLSALERLDVRATFFLVGELCAQNPQLVKAIAARGHELASHGYTHRRFTQLSDEELLDELARTRALLPPAAAGRELVRPPFGAVSLRSLLTCSRSGFTTVLWSLNSGDWCHKQARDVESTFTSRVTDAGEIVLLHEGQTWTIDALPTIVGAIRKAGHELVTVGELLD